MQIKTKKRNSFNDGIIGIYKESDSLINTDFNAKTNARAISDYEHIMDLWYSEQSKRQEDFLFAEAMGKKLTWKIKTPLVEGVDVSHKVIHDGVAYDIINLDPDRANKELYIYLERGRKLAE